MAVTQPDEREQIWDFVREVLVTRGNNSSMRKTARELVQGRTQAARASVQPVAKGSGWPKFNGHFIY